MDARKAGDRNDPTGVVEVFFASNLGYSDEAAIDAASRLVEHLSSWGLDLVPTAHVEEMEEKVRRSGAGAS